MSEPLKENEALETELIAELWKIFERMAEDGSHLPQRYLEDMGRPFIRLFGLDVAIKEAERCQAYGQIGSPRILELKRGRNKQAFEVAKLKAK